MTVPYVEGIHDAEGMSMDLYVATNGNDDWTGRRATPNRDHTDGPLATLGAARDAVRRMKSDGYIQRAHVPRSPGGLREPVTVHVRGGRHVLDQPLVFTPDDSWPMTFAPYRDEKPIISGGVRITGWRKTRVHGRSAWVADLPNVASGKWHFRQLFVNGRRAPRPRLPDNGLYRMHSAPGMPLPAKWGAGGYTQFVCRAGDVRPFANLEDVEIVYLHFWIEERSPIESFDEARNLVHMSRPSRAPLVGTFGDQLADYYLDNVFEALRKPGQWYLDRPTGRLYYLPRRNETPANTEIIAPKLFQLVGCIGDCASNAYVEQIRFEGLTFAHTDWRHPSQDGASVLGEADLDSASLGRRHARGPDASASQAACDVPGVITFQSARHCSLVDCTIEHVGWYGVEIGDACRNVHIVGSTIRDMGAGGVKINGAAACDPDVTLRRTGDHAITDNHITAGGRVFHSAVGVLSMNAFGMRIAHNHIHDLYYTGVSCGWEWGYQESVSRDNLIEFNHIHDIGQGLLSDMGGIYTLGVQPGTVLRNNHIHDIHSAHYGGWCIYPDEGSSHLLIADNVCYDADRHAFHQHYGRENVVVNNIWAFGGDAVATYSRGEPHLGFTMLRNIFITDGKPMYAVGYGQRLADRRFRMDSNLYFDVSGKRPTFMDRGEEKRTWTQWRELGHDRSSIVADPKCRSIKQRNFTLAKDSPAAAIGFEPIDLSRVGPRPKSKRD